MHWITSERSYPKCLLTRQIQTITQSFLQRNGSINSTTQWQSVQRHYGSCWFEIMGLCSWKYDLKGELVGQIEEANSVNWYPRISLLDLLEEYIDFLVPHNQSFYIYSFAFWVEESSSSSMPNTCCLIRLTKKEMKKKMTPNFKPILLKGLHSNYFRPPTSPKLNAIAISQNSNASTSKSFWSTVKDVHIKI